MNRRGFLVGLFAPAIIRTPGLLMPVKPAKEWLHISGIYPAPGTIKFEPVPIIEGGRFVTSQYLTGGYSWSLHGDQLWDAQI